MDASSRKKVSLVLLSVLAISAVVLLGGGLSNVELSEGQPLPRMQQEEREFVPPKPPTDIATLVWRVLLLVTGALLPFAIIYYIVSPRARRRLFRDLLTMLTVLLVIYTMARLEPEAFETVQELPAAEGLPGELPPVPEATFAPDPSQWLVLAVTIGLAVLLAAILVGLAWALWRRREHSAMSLDKLAREAQQAVDAIEAGADLRDTVTRCYFEMMQVLKEERGIRRQRAMTPREFEKRLEELGIPITQVRLLTRLFEDVRYGDKPLGQREERQAVVSLTSIIRFCRSVS